MLLIQTSIQHFEPLFKVTSLNITQAAKNLFLNIRSFLNATCLIVDLLSFQLILAHAMPAKFRSLNNVDSMFNNQSVFIASAPVMQPLTF